MKSIEVPIEILSKAITDIHGCKALWVESVHVKETFQGKTVWEGVVQVFNLFGHPPASRCYAWGHEMEDGEDKLFAVLHQGSVNSAQAAVRTAILNEYHGNTSDD